MASHQTVQGESRKEQGTGAEKSPDLISSLEHRTRELGDVIGYRGVK